MEMKGLAGSDKAHYKKKLAAHKKALATFKNTLDWKTTQNTRSELLSGYTPEAVMGPDFDTEKGLMKYGKDLLDEDASVLQRTLTKVEETKVIGASTAIKVQEQTNQIEGMYDDLFKIEDTMGYDFFRFVVFLLLFLLVQSLIFSLSVIRHSRSKAIMKRMFRKIRTDKYIWVSI